MSSHDSLYFDGGIGCYVADPHRLVFLNLAGTGHHCSACLTVSRSTTGFKLEETHLTHKQALSSAEHTGMEPKGKGASSDGGVGTAKKSKAAAPSTAKSSGAETSEISNLEIKEDTDQLGRTNVVRFNIR